MTRIISSPRAAVRRGARWRQRLAGRSQGQLHQAGRPAFVKDDGRHAAGKKLTAPAWNRDPREIRTHHRAQSAGAQSALGRKPAEEQVFRPTLRHLADRVASPTRDEFEGLTWSLYQFGKTITAAQYQLCWASLQGLSRRVAAWHQLYDAWITPVLATPPMKIGAINFEETDLVKGFAPIASYVPFTGLQNIEG
jgi:hypothetical protein